MVPLLSSSQKNRLSFLEAWSFIRSSQPVGCVTGELNLSAMRWEGRIGKIRRNGHHPLMAVNRTQMLWETGCRFDQSLVEIQPSRLIKGDCRNNTTFLAVSGHKTAFLNRSLNKSNCVSEGWHANRFDVDAKLRRPEGGHRDVRTPLPCRADHVVGGDFCLCHRIAPVLKGYELVVVEGMRETSHIPSDENIVGNDRIEIKGTATCITRDSPVADSESRIAQPFRIANSAECDDRKIDIERTPIGEISPLQS